MKIEFLTDTNQNREVLKVKNSYLQIHDKYLKILVDMLCVIDGVEQFYYEDTRIFKEHIYEVRILRTNDKVAAKGFAIMVDDRHQLDFNNYEDAKNCLDKLTEWKVK